MMSEKMRQPHLQVFQAQSFASTWCVVQLLRSIGPMKSNTPPQQNDCRLHAVLPYPQTFRELDPQHAVLTLA